MASAQFADLDPTLARAYALGKVEFEQAHPGKSTLVTCTYRSPEEQFLLFQKGRVKGPQGWVLDTDPKTAIVTQLDGRTHRSKHNFKPARALDFACLIHGKVSWDPVVYALTAPFFKRYGALWGGDWPRFRDYPHLELP